MCRGSSHLLPSPLNQLMMEKSRIAVATRAVPQPMEAVAAEAARAAGAVATAGVALAQPLGQGSHRPVRLQAEGGDEGMETAEDRGRSSAARATIAAGALA